VLSTFVVEPKRWLDRFGKRPLTDTEVEATVRYFRELGRRMNIKDAPETYAGFERLMDDYEAAHFAFDEGGRRVADATLRLLTTFRPWLPATAVEVAGRALMDPPLLDAFGYRRPSAAVVALVHGALRVRGFVLRFFPARRRRRRVADMPWVRSYPDGYRVEDLGTFPGGSGARTG
jgi:ER-bound oxygenase mpaB/B'/Rubber oxygenase, catalytic domain